MIRIHLAQILFKPAYFDPPTDFLEEPSPYSDPVSTLGKLRSEDVIQSFLFDCRSFYLDHILEKASQIVSWSGERGARFLVFPEYSIPYQVLPKLRELSKTYSIVLVAGTHRVKVSEDSKRVYESIGLQDFSIIPGAAISPIFLPDASTKAAVKLHKSKWEANLTTPDIPLEAISVTFGDVTIKFAVIPCIDCLHPDIIGQVLQSSGKPVELIICPSLSPSSEHFKNIGKITALEEIVLAYVNTSIYGGTFFNLPLEWQAYLQGPATGANYLEPAVEAILEIDVEQNMFFMKKGSVKSSPICHHPMMYPIIFENTSDWLPAFNGMCSDVVELLQSSDIDSATEWLDSYLAEQSQNIPRVIKQNLTYFRHSVLPLFDGQLDSIKKLTSLVLIDKTTCDSSSLFANHINQALSILSNFIMDPEHRAIDGALECIRTLKTYQTVPPVHSAVMQIPSSQRVNPITQVGFAGDDDLIESFQDRGNDLESLRDIFARSDIRLIVITGAIGIGKSSFINSFFRKILTDWEVIRIKVASDTKFPRILADVGYNVGIPLDVDSLSYCSSKVFEQKILRVLREFFKQARRCLVIDDLNQLLAQKNARDFKQLKLFIDKAISLEAFTGGRIILASSQWLPDSWLRQKAIIHHGLKRVHDKYARRIIEYNMRKVRAFSDEELPEVPQAILDLVNGHPLSAKLVVEASRNQTLSEFANATNFEEVSGYVAKELLKYVKVEPEDAELLMKFSVLRVPVSMKGLLSLDGFKDQKEDLLGLVSRCVLSFDGSKLEMHESIRRHFLSKISRKSLERYHADVVGYFQRQYQSDGMTSQKDPTILGELAYHLSQANKINEHRDIRTLVINEIKPSARKIYREYHDYQKALQLYRLIHDVVPDDVEVAAYLGRCYARLQQWMDSDVAFDNAIGMAKAKRQPYWWIYRDWGHIRARFGYYAIAIHHFDLASDTNPSDFSIKSSIAYMYWRQGLNNEARELFEEALSLNNLHEYTLKYYSKFLMATGDTEYGESLRKKFYAVEENALSAEPNEYDIEDDFDE